MEPEPKDLAALLVVTLSSPWWLPRILREFLPKSKRNQEQEDNARDKEEKNINN